MKRSRLNPVSKKRAVLNREYAKAKREWRAQHPGFCEMRFEDPARTIHAPSLLNSLAMGVPSLPCRRRAAAQPHHVKKRGPFLCDISTFMGLCPQCHSWVHSNENEARRLGYLLV